MAELGVSADRQTYRLRGREHHILLKTWIIAGLNSNYHDKQQLFPHRCQRVYNRQVVVIGETCWRCDSGIWGLEQPMLNCQAEGRFAAVEQKLLRQDPAYTLNAQVINQLAQTRDQKRMRNAEGVFELPAPLQDSDLIWKPTVLQQQCCCL